MLNKKGERELCYVVKIDNVESIPGKDRVECACVGGWTVMVRKNQFNKGDLAVYFEIDSKVDISKPEYNFLESKHGKIKTQGYKNPDGSKFYSQGLIMSFEDVGLDKSMYSEGDLLTEKLGVTYSSEEDNKRKSNKNNPDKKYHRMMSKHPKLAKSKFGRWCMKHNITKRLLYIIFGRGCNSKSNVYPEWVVKTDEERIQNCFNIMRNIDTKWIATEKRDGTSTTFTLKRKNKGYDYAVCSRNVRMEQKKDGGWYDSNVYVNMSDKYNIKNVLKDILENNSELDFVTLQGESFGCGIQKRNYGLKEVVFEAFNLIYGYKDGNSKRFNPLEMKQMLNKYNIPCVPICGEYDRLSNNCSEVLYMAKGEASIYGGMREGLVFRSIDGKYSFKAVDNDFIIKYH